MDRLFQEEPDYEGEINMADSEFEVMQERLDVQTLRKQRKERPTTPKQGYFNSRQ